MSSQQILEPRRLTSAADLAGLAEAARSEQNLANKVVRVCVGTACIAKKAEAVLDSFEKAATAHADGENRVQARPCGCQGLCSLGPVVVVSPSETFYGHTTAKDVPQIFNDTVLHDKPVERLLHKQDGEVNRTRDEIPFFSKQQRNVLGLNGIVNPMDILDAIVHGVYVELARTLAKRTPSSIIDEIELSGLRGRGGAGFPTGRKWRMMQRQAGASKYIICNGDEGDPGAYMDRSLMEGNPHSVVEGMIIGGFATGASEGIVYVRSEYPYAVRRVSRAIDHARAWGFLGENILGSDFSFDIRVFKGSGAFVCGEETALIASIEGGRGMPRPRPPYPVVSGLWGRPTVINNVETWVNIPLILAKGADWFARIGTEGSKGTKVFSLVGQVKNTGLIEVPMGITLKEIVEDIGGGARNGATLKAVQSGGPSGGCIPADKFDLPVDYESLKAAGSIMGSGGLVVMDDTSCMVDVAKFFLSFTQQESCGKCPPCRVGTRAMLSILDRISDGRGEAEDLDTLERLANTIQKASLCGLGQTAPNPVRTTLRYFREEFEEHIHKQECRAFVCTPLVNTFIDEERCVGCRVCIKACPSDAITGELKKLHVIDQDKCVSCGSCLAVCPPKAAAVFRTSGNLTRFEPQKQKKSGSSRRG